MMPRQYLKELDDLSAILAAQGLLFDEDKAKQEGVVKYELHDLRVPVRSDVLDPGNFYAILEEKEQAARLRSVRVDGLDAESLILKPDHFGIGFYRSGSRNRACDFLILTKYNGDKYALFVDLKTVIGEFPIGTDGEILSFNGLYDQKMVWQMIGADATFDGLLDSVVKNGAVQRMTAHDSKRACATSALAEYKRRYLILYMRVDVQAKNMTKKTQTPICPNDLALESPVHVYRLAVSRDGKSKVSLGCFFGQGHLPL